MSTFYEANQVRLGLKMKLSVHYWYSSSRVASANDGFGVVVSVKQLDNTVRKTVPQVVDGISIRTEEDK
jgi:hypothetical protein